MKAPRLLLSHRLFVLAAAALLPGLAILAFNEVSLRASRESELHTYAARLSEQAALEIERVVTGAAALMVAVASAPTVQQSDASACAGYLTHLQSVLPQIDVITVADQSRRLVCTSGSSATGEDLIFNTEDVLEALNANFFAVGRYVEVGGLAGLSLGTTITDQTGSTIGYVLASVSVDYLDRLCGSARSVQAAP